MTRNQIEYNKLLEEQRTNKANEQLTASRDSETGRHNVAMEGLQRVSLDEQHRSNLAREAETNRANLASEKLKGEAQAEQARANMRREALQSELQQETARANRAKEQFNLSSLAETRRNNIVLSNLRSQEIDINRSRASEEARANQARESETHRANLAREEETKRSNLAAELELNRHNVNVESETHRTNAAREAIDIGRAATYAADVAARALLNRTKAANGGGSTNISVNPHISVSPTQNASSVIPNQPGKTQSPKEVSKSEQKDWHVEALEEALSREQAKQTAKEWNPPSRGGGFGDRSRGFGSSYGKK